MLPVNIITSDSDPSEITKSQSSTLSQIQDKGFDAFSSFSDFKDTYEEAFVNHFYKTYNSSYKLASRLKISQSTASRLIMKYVDKNSDEWS